MKPKLFTIIILGAFISLLGVVIMQVFWVQNAISLKEEQYNNSVRIAMKSVINSLLEIRNDSMISQINTEKPCFEEKTTLQDIISLKVLDSLIKTETSCMKVGNDYEYMIYSRKNQRIAMGNVKNYAEELLLSEHQQSIAAIYKPGDYYFSIYFPEQASVIFWQLARWMLLSAVFLLVIILSFWYTIYTIIKQKKNSQIRKDFINNMTHEFKTPIATISIASQMLLKPEIILQQEKASRYAQVISQENNRLQNQVEQILQIALIDRDEAEMNFRSCNVHELLQELISAFQLRIDETNGKLAYTFDAQHFTIDADPLHLYHAFSNILDNAIKYNKDKPEIFIQTSNSHNSLKISFHDKGIGIAPENHRLIFKNLYRVHTGDVHDVKGFGIGLYYVQRIIQKHGGSIKVKSGLNKGSTFVVHLAVETQKTKP